MDYKESQWLDHKSDFPKDRVSYSVLKELARSPGDALYKKKTPTVATPSMEFGKAVDACLFADSSGNTMVEIHSTSASTRTKEFREAKEEALAEYPDLVYLDAETGKNLGLLLDAVKETTLWKEHMVEGQEFHYNKAGVLIERISKDARQCVANIIDVVGWGDNLEVEKIVDLKVVADTTPHAFRNQIDRMRWDVQAASYVRMVEDITGKRVPFYWFVVRNTPPWTCAYYQMDEKWLDAAEDQLVNWIYEWFNWKNEKLDGNARCANVQTVTLSKPPWRT